MHACSGYGVLPQLSETFPSLKFMPNKESGPLLVEGQNPERVRTVRDSQSDYSEVCLPNDANLLGNMLGGHVMHLVDLCGGIAA